jgi:dTDP-4-amino-4,6-dideoxygalactose transaminase
MLVAHYFGTPQPMGLVRQFCDRTGIILIEDCAHAMFGAVDGKAVGTWGDFAIASLTKFFPVTDGGCLIVNSAEATPRLPERRTMGEEFRGAVNAIELGARHGKLGGLNSTFNALFGMVHRLRPRARSGGHSSSTDRLDLSSPASSPANPAPTAINSSDASVWAKWIARTAHREHIVATRRRNYQQWTNAVEAIAGARAVLPLADAAAPYVFPLWVEHPEASYKRIRAAGVPIFRWDEVWPGTPAIDDDCGIEWATHVYQLGCHQDLSVDDLSRMAQRVRQILSVTGTSSQNGNANRAAAIT